MSKDNPGLDVVLSFCPGTKKFPCSTVSFSQDKKFLTGWDSAIFWDKGTTGQTQNLATGQDRPG